MISVPANPQQARALLRELFACAVAAADPHHALPPHLPVDTRRPARVIGAGKAAAAMAAALQRHWQGPLSGVVVTAYGHTEPGITQHRPADPRSHIAVREAAHPVPDAAGEQAARELLASLAGLRAGDLVLCLLSGGGSSLLALPAPGLTLADKQLINRALLAAGAPIDEINCVRKHLSAIKGGRLARAAAPAQLISYAISDVTGDDPGVIASGPTTADPTTRAMASGILARYGITVPGHVQAWLDDPRAETPKPGDAAFATSTYTLIATPADAIASAAAAARRAGLDVTLLGADLAGDAQALAREQAAAARQALRAGRPCVLLSGGETTVAVRGSGRGGRNSHYLLSLAMALAGTPGVYALAADTDGVDGNGDHAGALLAPDSLARASALGLDAATLLAHVDSYRFFDAIGDLVITGPTRTNVNDFRAILVLP